MHNLYQWITCDLDPYRMYPVLKIRLLFLSTFDLNGSYPHWNLLNEWPGLQHKTAQGARLASIALAISLS